MQKEIVELRRQLEKPQERIIEDLLDEKRDLEERIEELENIEEKWEDFNQERKREKDLSDSLIQTVTDALFGSKSSLADFEKVKNALTKVME